jgi:hypothetical protein
MVPLLTAAADLLENGATAYLAWSYDGRVSPVAWLAAICTATKTLLFIASLALTLVGSVRGLRRAGFHGSDEPSDGKPVTNDSD